MRSTSGRSRSICSSRRCSEPAEPRLAVRGGWVSEMVWGASAPRHQCGRRPGPELPGPGGRSLGGLADLEDLGTADGAGAGGRGFAVLHSDRLSALDLALFLAFEAIASGHVLLRGVGVVLRLLGGRLRAF